MKNFQAVLLAVFFGVVIFGLNINTVTAQAIKPWAKIDDQTQRFKTLDSYGGKAVLDRETGLVWETSPTTSATTWADAKHACVTKWFPNESPGAIRGFRLPKIEELATLEVLVVSSGTSNPPIITTKLAGDATVFGPVSGPYWTATESYKNPDMSAYVVFFGDQNWAYQWESAKTVPNKVWCVRGGAN